MVPTSWIITSVVVVIVLVFVLISFHCEAHQRSFKTQKHTFVNSLLWQYLHPNPPSPPTPIRRHRESALSKQHRTSALAFRYLLTLLLFETTCNIFVAITQPIPTHPLSPLRVLALRSINFVRGLLASMTVSLQRNMNIRKVFRPNRRFSPLSSFGWVFRRQRTVLPNSNVFNWIEINFIRWNVACCSSYDWVELNVECQNH